MPFFKQFDEWISPNQTKTVTVVTTDLWGILWFVRPHSTVLGPPPPAPSPDLSVSIQEVRVEASAAYYTHHITVRASAPPGVTTAFLIEGFLFYEVLPP